MSVRVIDYPSVKEPEKYRGKSKKYVITSSEGLEVAILNYGGIIQSLMIPDSKGNMADIVLGNKDLDAYMLSCANHGALVGRSANRIAGAKFSINGIEYQVPDNDGGNNLHGGAGSYQKLFWDACVISAEEADKMVAESGIKGIDSIDGDAVLLSCVSPDGTDGFPGNLETEVLYAWTEDATLLILYKGTSDKDTIFAPTNHAYFNLAGHNAGSVKDNILVINADQVTVKAANNCPDGKLMDVENTIFDFREGDKVAKVLNEDDPQTCNSRGIDQNFCLNVEPDKFSFVASLVEPKSTRCMEVYTDLPGMQVYAGNHLCGDDQKGDICYKQYGAICLEAQMYPNAVNVPEFDSPIIKAGETKYHACGYKFI